MTGVAFTLVAARYRMVAKGVAVCFASGALSILLVYWDAEPIPDGDAELLARHEKVEGKRR